MRKFLLPLIAAPMVGMATLLPQVASADPLFKVIVHPFPTVVEAPPERVVVVHDRDDWERHEAWERHREWERQREIERERWWRWHHPYERVVVVRDPEDD